MESKCINMFLFSSIILMPSCDKEYDKLNGTTVELLSFDNKFIMVDGSQADGYYSDRNKFIEKHVSKEVKGDTIFASTLFEVNACGKKDGIIKVSGDTIYLKTEVSGDLCASIEFHKCFYKIKVDSINKYVIYY